MRFSELRHTWWTWTRVMNQLNRYSDLKRLVRWAERKRLPGPRITYERQLHRMVQTLVTYKVRFPRLVRWAHRLHRLNALINPPPRVWPKGSAEKYRLRASC